MRVKMCIRFFPRKWASLYESIQLSDQSIAWQNGLAADCNNGSQRGCCHDTDDDGACDGALVFVQSRLFRMSNDKCFSMTVQKTSQDEIYYTPVNKR